MLPAHGGCRGDARRGQGRAARGEDGARRADAPTFESPAGTGAAGWADYRAAMRDVLVGRAPTGAMPAPVAAPVPAPSPVTPPPTSTNDASPWG